MAIGQIERADVVVLVIDADLGPSEQDARIAGKVEEAGRALVIALNKSDLVTGDAKKAALRDLSEETFHFLTWAPVTMISAQRGDGVDRLLDLVEQGRRAAPQADPDRAAQPVLRRGDRGDAAAAPQGQGDPDQLHHAGRDASRRRSCCGRAPLEGLAPSYKRFISNRLREAYGFRGTPIRIFVKEKKDRHDTASDRLEEAPARAAAQADRRDRDVAGERRDPDLEPVRAIAARSQSTPPPSWTTNSSLAPC